MGVRREVFQWRWFVLCEAVLLYYEPPVVVGDAAPGVLAALPPSPKGAVALVEGFETEVADTPEADDYRLTIIMPSRRLLLRTDSRADRNRWLEALRASPLCQDVEGRVFGRGLLELIDATAVDGVPGIIVNCMAALTRPEALATEGLFRVAGATAEARQLRRALNRDQWAPLGDYSPATIATVLKRYLREMPEPLLIPQLYAELMAAVGGSGDRVQKLMAIFVLLRELPAENMAALVLIMRGLWRLTQTEASRMTPMAVGVVLAPNLLTAPDGAANPLADSGLQIELCALMVEYAESYFFVQ